MKIKVTGYQIREAIRKWNLKRDMLAAAFKDSLKRFQDEQKPDPSDVMRDYKIADRTIALLQVAQDHYNLGITIDDKGTPLAIGVKLLGGAGRMEKMWRSVAAPEENRYGGDGSVRRADEVTAAPTVTKAEAFHLAEEAGNYSAELRKAIATANATMFEVDVEGLEAQALA